MKNLRIQIFLLLIPLLLNGLQASGQGLQNDGFLRNVRNALGVTADDNFALILEGDTLMSQSHQQNVRKVRLFDERLKVEVFDDSVEEKLVWDGGGTVSRWLLPDTTKIWDERSSQNRRVATRFARDGEKKWMRDSSASRISTTYYLAGDVQKTITAHQKGWGLIWRGPDSSYQARYSLDSILLSENWSTTSADGAYVSGNYYRNPPSRSLTKRYRSEDSTYFYNRRISGGDTTMSIKWEKTFPEKDSAFSVQIRKTEAGADSSFEQTYVKDGVKRSEFYNSARGRGTAVIFDSLTLSRRWSHEGELLHREKRISNEKGDLRVEILENEDSTYYQVNHFHQLYWKNDTDHIGYLYPFSKQLFFNEDSVLVKEVTYNFEPHQWPEIIIETKGEKRIISSDSSKFSKYRKQAVFCEGARGGTWGFHPKYDTIFVEGLTNSEVEEQIKQWLRDEKLLGTGTVWPLFYVFYTNGSDEKLISSDPLPDRDSKGLKEILQKTEKDVDFYKNGLKENLRGLLMKVEYTTATYTRINGELRRSR